MNDPRVISFNDDAFEVPGFRNGTGFSSGFAFTEMDLVGIWTATFMGDTADFTFADDGTFSASEGDCTVTGDYASIDERFNGLRLTNVMFSMCDVSPMMDELILEGFIRIAGGSDSGVATIFNDAAAFQISLERQL